MDIRKPKPIHNWRELAKEVGIIVLGVLIALGAEQGVRLIEWHHKSKVAAEAMRVELSSDDGPQVAARYAIHDCVDQVLVAIRNGVERRASRAEVIALIAGHKTKFWTWDSLAYSSANSSDVALHMPGNSMQLWTNAYATMPALNQANAKEFADGAELTALSSTGGPLTEAERSQVLRAVEMLRRDNGIIFASVRVTLPAIYAAGVKLDAKVVKLIDDKQRIAYGDACQVVPPGA